jgi:phenylpropionate dioxygenase-like ring-hydroxylating dioxygenase large terminal subunit
MYSNVVEPQKRMYETSGLLVNSWYAAGLSASFKADKPQRVEIFEIPLVIWRDADGKVSALLDKCNHRNAPLSEGRIIDKCVVCPYHGWSYNSDGQCVEIPSEGPNPVRIPNKKVEKFPTIEENGLIWVWMGRDKVPDKKPYPMPQKSGEGWSHYYMVTDFDNNVTDLVENFMDVPHTVFVHKGWFRDRKQIRIEAKVERTEDSVLVTYDQSNDSIGFSNWLINPKKLPMKHTDNFYMPNNTQVDYIFGDFERGFIITSTCTPIKPFKTRVYTLITYKFGWLNPIARIGLNAYTRKVINQDVWIMKIHGENIQHLGETDYKSTQCDTMHLYIESLRYWAEANGEKPKPKPMIKNIEFWV